MKKMREFRIVAPPIATEVVCSMMATRQLRSKKLLLAGMSHVCVCFVLGGDADAAVMRLLELDDSVQNTGDASVSARGVISPAELSGVCVVLD